MQGLLLVCLLGGLWQIRAAEEAGDDDVALSNSTKVCPAPSPCTCDFEKAFTKKNGTYNIIDCSDKILNDEDLPMLIPTMEDFSRVNFSRNAIGHFPPNYFDNITGIEILDLTTNHFTKVPKALRHMENLTHVYLKDNSISLRKGSQFEGLSSIKFIDLSFNRIANITNGTFQGLVNLTHLILKYNKIGAIEPGTFLDLPNLQYLYLDGNHLKTLVSGMFDGLLSIKKMYLGSNDLKILEDGCFSGLDSLEYLTLRSNDIKDFFPATFTGLTNLTLISFSFNRVETLPKGVFAALDKIESMYAYLNDMKEIDANVFNGIEDTLKNLYLGYNYFADLNDEFLGLKNLEVLALDGNPITKLPNLHGLTKLKRLGITGSHIATIYPCEIHNMKNLNHIDWGMSPIKCDCNLKWMLEWLKNESEKSKKLREQYEYYFTWFCTYPEAMKDVEFAQLSAANLTCEHGEEPQWCRPHKTKVKLSMLVSRRKGKIYFNWHLRENVVLSLSHVKVVLIPTIKKHKGSFELVLPFNANDTVISEKELDHNEHYKACVRYIGTNGLVLVQNCTQLVSSGRHAPKGAIAGPILLFLLICSVIAGIIIYRRKFPPMKGRRVKSPTGDTISGIENIGFGADGPNVTMSQLKMDETDLEKQTSDI